MDKVNNVDMESNNDFRISNCNAIQILAFYYIYISQKV